MEAGRRSIPPLRQLFSFGQHLSIFKKGVILAIPLGLSTYVVVFIIGAMISGGRFVFGVNNQWLAFLGAISLIYFLGLIVANSHFQGLVKKWIEKHPRLFFLKLFIHSAGEELLAKNFPEVIFEFSPGWKWGFVTKRLPINYNGKEDSLCLIVEASVPGAFTGSTWWVLASKLHFTGRSAFDTIMTCLSYGIRQDLSDLERFLEKHELDNKSF